MPSTPTSRNRLNLQGSGDNVGNWGTVLNSQVFNLLDEALDGVTTLTVTTDVALSSQNYATDQSRRRIIKLVGSPNASVTITLPSVEKFYLVHNATNVAHTVKAGGAGVSVPASTLTYVYCDGTDTVSPSIGLTAPVGTVMDFGGAVAPAGWLLCAGQAVSRTTYTSLFQVIGTAYGAGNGSSTFNLPDCRGRFRLSSDIMGGTQAGRVNGVIANPLGSAGGNQFLTAHSHPNTATATTTVSLGSMSASGAANVTYLDWTTPVTTAALATGGTGILVPASTGSDVVRTVFNQPVSVSLFGAPSASTSVAMGNAVAGAGASQNIPPCLVFNTIIYAGA
jgi:microcystin-dependent protein